MAASNYAVEFDERHTLSERVLWPTGPAESHGMEDASSCGSMIHGDAIVLPYGCSDSSVRTATVDLSLLLDRLRPG
jgi:predicted GH43/DUF377 family glycosyl hydrolase